MRVPRITGKGDCERPFESVAKRSGAVSGEPTSRVALESLPDLDKWTLCFPPGSDIADGDSSIPTNIESPGFDNTATWEASVAVAFFLTNLGSLAELLKSFVLEE